MLPSPSSFRDDIKQLNALSMCNFTKKKKKLKTVPRYPLTTFFSSLKSQSFVNHFNDTSGLKATYFHARSTTPHT